MIDAKLELAGVPDVWDEIESLRQNTLDVLAPAMRAAIIATLKCAQGQTITVTLHGGSPGQTDTLALDPIVHETLRGDALQAIYYAQGATRAKTAAGSWHYYGLAADLISESYGWFTDATARRRWPSEADRAIVADAWFRALGTIAERFGLAWGGEWPTFPDLPHVQWGQCARSPHAAPAIYAAAGGALLGRQAVWRAVHADVVTSTLAEDAA